MLRVGLIAILFCFSALSALAQQDVAPPAVLVADEVIVAQNRVLTARGNVEAFQGQTRLRASAITYDGTTGLLVISGPIVIEEGDDIRILANQGELDRDLQNGLLIGARLVLNQHLQLASVEMNRVGGRYTQLYRTAVTSCRVCQNDPLPPLWQIRAQRVVHDQEERQLYFDRAQLLVRGVPVFYLPRLRLPDPTLERATGFLIPSVRTTSQLGTGVKVPYFFKLGDHRDLTVTPYFSTSTATLELRYRQAFRRGRIEFEGAITNDDLRPGETRAYLFGFGNFDLKRDYRLRFDVQLVSDDAYLRDYDYSDLDRLRNRVIIDRTKRNHYTGFGFVNFRTLRENEDNSTLPTNIFEALYERRIFPATFGGELRLHASGNARYRESDLDVDSADPDTIVDGRDVLRATFGADWNRSWFLGGLETQVRLGTIADVFQIGQDANSDNDDAEITPYSALTFRYPMTRRIGRGTQFLEPLAQLAWSGGSGLDVPNEESVFVEFDEGNLLGLSRFPGADRRERGAVAAVGVNFTHYDMNGWRAGLTFGQVFREDDSVRFSSASGLADTTSDYLLATQYQTANGLELTARGLFDDSFEFSKAELRGGWRSDRFDLSGAYVFLAADPLEDRDDAIAEFNFDGTFDIGNDWSAMVDWRYDFDDGRASRAGLGLAYTNECTRMEFSVDRRFTSSTSIEAQTSFGLTLSLRGFSTSAGTDKHVRACGKNAI